MEETSGQVVGSLRPANHRGMVVSQFVVGDLVADNPLHRLYRCRTLVGGRSGHCKIISDSYLRFRSRHGFHANPFISELHAAAAVGSHHVVRHLEAGTSADGEHFLVRECPPGELLSTLLERRAKLSLPEAISVLVDLSTAVEHLHGLGIGQVNLHPTNVAMTTTESPHAWHARLVDLGGCALLNQPCELRPEALVQHPDFLTPEHAKGTNLVTGSDMFQLGILFHMLLAGEHPLELGEGDVAAVLSALGSDRALPRKRLRDSVQGLPDEADMLVGKMLKSSTAERPGTADMVIRGMELVLREWQAQHQDQPVPKELWSRLAR